MSANAGITSDDDRADVGSDVLRDVFVLFGKPAVEATAVYLNVDGTRTARSARRRRIGGWLVNECAY
jgi:hypothetical protein